MCFKYRSQCYSACCLVISLGVQHEWSILRDAASCGPSALADIGLLVKMMVVHQLWFGQSVAEMSQFFDFSRWRPSAILDLSQQSDLFEPSRVKIFRSVSLVGEFPKIKGHKYKKWFHFTHHMLSPRERICTNLVLYDRGRRRNHPCKIFGDPIRARRLCKNRKWPDAIDKASHC